VLLWYVALGSALGGVTRYLLGGLIQRGPGFPVGTLIINITGSFLVGLFYRYAAESALVSPEMRVFLTIGFCGGYTTFSTFSFETVRLLEDGETARALAYVALSVLVSVAAAFLGMAAGRELLHLRRG
jgi:CrcB protein